MIGIAEPNLQLLLEYLFICEDLERKMYVIMSCCVMCNNINLEEDDDNNDIIANDNETTDK